MTKYENYVQHELVAHFLIFKAAFLNSLCTSSIEWDSVQAWSLLVQTAIPTNGPMSIEASLLLLAWGFNYFQHRCAHTSTHTKFENTPKKPIYTYMRLLNSLGASRYRVVNQQKERKAVRKKTLYRIFPFYRKEKTCPYLYHAPFTLPHTPIYFLTKKKIKPGLIVVLAVVACLEMSL